MVEDVAAAADADIRTASRYRINNCGSSSSGNDRVSLLLFVGTVFGDDQPNGKNNKMKLIV